MPASSEITVAFSASTISVFVTVLPPDEELPEELPPDEEPPEELPPDEELLEPPPPPEEVFFVSADVLVLSSALE